MVPFRFTTGVGNIEVFESSTQIAVDPRQELPWPKLILALGRRTPYCVEELRHEVQPLSEHLLSVI